MQANAAIIDANERIKLLSQRLGRIISKFDKIDDKNTVFLAWVQDYTGLKNNMTDLWSTIWGGQKDFSDFCSTQKISLASPMAYSLFSCNAYFARFHAKVETLDDILSGLIEDILDCAHLEAMQKEEIKKAMKGAIEKTKEMPKVMYG